MNEQLGLRTLAQVMQWSNDLARTEYEWLRLMSRFKYDGYRDFVAGVQFLESLITWLSQFPSVEERQTAYDFIKCRLIYVGPAEMKKLVELFYFEHVRPFIAYQAASKLEIQPHRLWTHPDGRKMFSQTLRHALFMGLSEGAHVDMLRYVARADLTNEQVVGFTQIDADKWADLLKDLRTDTKDPNARFQYLYVLDDFTASGTSLLRKRGDKWKGKLIRLLHSLERAKEELKTSPLADDWILYVHHYLATRNARQVALERIREAASELGDAWFPRLKLTFSTVLDPSIEITAAAEPRFMGLVDIYYDASIEPKKHLIESGIDDLKRGYGACALPLVLDHNAPNNSLALIWAESSGEKGHRMRPLFRRHQRHG